MSNDQITLCECCWSMTKTIDGKCGKCGEKKGARNMRLEHIKFVCHKCQGFPQCSRENDLGNDSCYIRYLEQEKFDHEKKIIQLEENNTVLMDMAYRNGIAEVKVSNKLKIAREGLEMINAVLDTKVITIDTLMDQVDEVLNICEVKLKEIKND